MLLDLHSATGSEFPAPDVCVIGAGAAGIVLATELAKQGKRVVILEGGGRTLELSSQALYDSTIIGHPHDGIHNGRFRVYGGSTTRWAGQLLEFTANDFAVRPWITGTGWPFGKETLQPYYARALTIEGMVGVETDDARVWRVAAGAVPDLGSNITPYLSRWTPEPNFVHLHGKGVAEADHIALYLHANVCGMAFDDAGRRIVAVTCRTLDGRTVEFHANTFVLCMGGIETVRFLLQPGRYPWNGHKLLGRHFQDRVSALSGEVTVRDRRTFERYFANIWANGWKYQPKFRLGSTMAQQEGLLDATAMMTFGDDQDVSTAQAKTTMRRVHSRNLRGISGQEARNVVKHAPGLVRRAWYTKRRGRAYHPPTTQVHLGVQCEQEPLGDSTIRLNGDRDPTGLFRVDLDWRISALELRTLARYSQVVAAAVEERKLATITLDRDALEDMGRFIMKCHDMKHHMGGARIASHRALGLVDPALRLYGTENGYVCSAAVFPCSGSANPTHTLIALAIRLADSLAGQSSAPATAK